MKKFIKTLFEIVCSIIAFIILLAVLNQLFDIGQFVIGR